MGLRREGSLKPGTFSGNIFFTAKKILKNNFSDRKNFPEIFFLFHFFPEIFFSNRFFLPGFFFFFLQHECHYPLSWPRWNRGVSSAICQTGRPFAAPIPAGEHEPLSADLIRALNGLRCTSFTPAPPVTEVIIPQKAGITGTFHSFLRRKNGGNK